MDRRLTIDGTVVDLPEKDFNISLVYEVNDNGIIMASRAKRQVVLPATSANNELFEDWGAITNDNPGASEFKDFTFENAGITLMTGKAQLVSGTLDANHYGFKSKSHKVDLYGNNADWFLQLKDTKLRDLDFVDVIYNAGQVLSGWYSSYDSGDYFGFTLIKWKEWQTPGAVQIDEFTPFLFIRSILEAMFSSIGYTIVSDFIETDLFKKLILVVPVPDRYGEEFSNDYINIVAEKPLSAVVPGISNPYIFTNQTTTPALANPYNTGTGVYTVPFTGYYEVSVRYSIQNNIGTAGFAASILVNAVPGVFTPNPIIFDGLVTVDTNYSATSNVVFLTAGDLITIYMDEGTTGSYDSYFELTIKGEAEIAFGSILAWRYLLQNWKCTDFILGLGQMFNLRFETNSREQIVYLEPADDYILRDRTSITTVSETVGDGFYISNTDDKDSFIDLSVDAELYNIAQVPDIEALSYMTEGDTEEYLQEPERYGIYTGTYTLLPNRFNPVTEERENPFFAKTIHTIDNEITYAGSPPTVPGSIYKVQVPLIYPQNYRLDPTATEANYEISPRILYFAGVRLSGFFAGWDGKINCVFSPGVPLGWPKAFMVNYVSELDPSLSFANETVNGVEVPGLLKSFWLQEYSRRRIGKRLETNYRWDSLSILALTFRDKVRLSGRNFILSKIDGFNPLNDNSTKTFFDLDIYPGEEDESAVGGTVLNGLVNPV